MRVGTGRLRNSVRRAQGRGGMPFVHLEHESGYRLAISEYGGQVLSWENPSGRELLFLSSAAAFEAGKAIRGGIPVVFPQFGKGPLPAHGFARTRAWSTVRESAPDSGAVSLSLRLATSAETEAMWPHPFTLDLEIDLSETLRMTLRATNTGDKSLFFCGALHTYFAVANVESCAIRGLEGCRYVDFLMERREVVESAPELVLQGATDRAYLRSPRAVSIHDREGSCIFTVTKEGFADTVVWNPWQEGNAAMQDLAPGAWRSMVCVESGNVLTPVELAPGATHESFQELRASLG